MCVRPFLTFVVPKFLDCFESAAFFMFLASFFFRALAVWVSSLGSSALPNPVATRVADAPAHQKKALAPTTHSKARNNHGGMRGSSL